MAFEDLPLSNYPTHYDDEVLISPPSPAYLPYPTDVTNIVDFIVKMRNSIIAIERELGTNPSGNQTTVARRLDLLEAVHNELIGIGRTIHRIQIADKYSLNSIYSTDLCVGQVGLNLYEESGLSNEDLLSLTYVEVFFKVHVYVERNAILTLKLYNVTSDDVAPILITEMTFNDTGTYYGGDFTRSEQLNLVSQIPLDDCVLEVRAFQEVNGDPDPEKKSIVWDASLIVQTTKTQDGYGITSRYVEPTADDLIVWKFDDEASSFVDTFINDGYAGTDGDLIASGTAHSPGACGIFEDAAFLSGDAMLSRTNGISPATISISMWINPTVPFTPSTDIALQKLDSVGNQVFITKVDPSGSICFDYLGTDGNTYSFNTPIFSFPYVNANWIFVGFVYDGYNVYTSVNGNYELAGVLVPGIKYEGPFDDGEGKWSLITSDLLIDDVRIAQVARNESWFKTVYKLGVGQYP